MIKQLHALEPDLIGPIKGWPTEMLRGWFLKDYYNWIFNLLADLFTISTVLIKEGLDQSSPILEELSLRVKIFGRQLLDIRIVRDITETESKIGAWLDHFKSLEEFDGKYLASGGCPLVDFVNL